ncbi:hypothetical protein [Natrinema versiforme]|uniref:Uncharacterized protein n=1 Tax=Natrinema versiforme TaxID=88724 RepID=A0A4V1FYT1_9EURY|nr:hypothetical protein [Natrinema versiforme]QCS41432.1 hypothetical protein FEJ81_03345 [Natrinema versiforme]
MGTSTDGLLALIALAAFLGLAFLTDASLSIYFLPVGGTGTIVFELLAARDPALVRDYWERWPVQLASLAVAIGGAAVGARVAPVPVLSLCCGATLTYLVFLALLRTGIIPPLETWWESDT